MNQSKLTRSLVRQGSANVYGCEVGDAVVVQWDERYSTHILYNKGPYLHFLHADSISSLGLRNAIEPFLARVVQREFCLVRKVISTTFTLIHFFIKITIQLFFRNRIATIYQKAPIFIA